MSEMLALNTKDIKELLLMTEVLEAVEHAFKLQSKKKVTMPSKIYLDLPEKKGDFRAMPAYIDGNAGPRTTHGQSGGNATGARR